MYLLLLDLCMPTPGLGRTSWTNSVTEEVGAACPVGQYIATGRNADCPDDAGDCRIRRILAVADLAPTNVIIAVAVGSGGQPIDCDQEAPSQGNVAVVNNYTILSSAIADNIYYCSPSAASVGTCWLLMTESRLCVDNSWDKMGQALASGDLWRSATAWPAGRHTRPVRACSRHDTRCLPRNGGVLGWE